MADNLVQVTLPTLSALPEDFIVNTWSFQATEPKDDATALEIETVLFDFYDNIASILSPTLTSTALITIKWYDRADEKPRAPWRTTSQSWEGGGGVALPSEVALVLSFQANAISGSPQARRRGRLFIGPLRQAAAGGGFNGDRPTTLTMETLADAAIGVLNASDATAEWAWQVWSQRDNLGRTVTNGWIDNAWDTHRSRGPEATSRVLWAGTP